MNTSPPLSKPSGSLIYWIFLNFFSCLFISLHTLSMHVVFTSCESLFSHYWSPLVVIVHVFRCLRSHAYYLGFYLTLVKSFVFTLDHSLLSCVVFKHVVVNTWTYKNGRVRSLLCYKWMSSYLKTLLLSYKPNLLRRWMAWWTLALAVAWAAFQAGMMGAHWGRRGSLGSETNLTQHQPLKEPEDPRGRRSTRLASVLMSLPLAME